MLELEPYYKLEFSCGGIIYYSEEKFRDRYNCLWDNVPVTYDEFLFVDSWLEDLEIPLEGREEFIKLTNKLEVTSKYKNFIRVFMKVCPS